MQYETTCVNNINLLFQHEFKVTDGYIIQTYKCCELQEIINVHDECVKLAKQHDCVLTNETMENGIYYADFEFNTICKANVFRQSMRLHSIGLQQLNEIRFTGTLNFKPRLPKSQIHDQRMFLIARCCGKA